MASVVVREVNFVHDYVMLNNSAYTSVTTWFLCAYQCLCT